MDTDSFKYVMVLAECKSISEAARKLFITQPALTKHLNKLEESLGPGVKLFDRSVSPIKITAAGEVFLEYSRQYVDLEKEMRDRLARVLRLQKGSVRLVSTSRGGWYLGAHISSFLERYPDIQLKLSSENALRCEEMLERGEVDLAVYTDPVQSDKIEYVPLVKDTLLLAVPKNYFLLEGKCLEGNSLEKPLELDPKELQNPRVRFVCSTPEHSIYYAEQAFFEKCNIHPVNPLRVDFINTRYSIACGGAGIVMVPVSTARRNDMPGTPIFCKVKGARLTRQVIIAKGKGRPLSLAGEIFWDYIIGESIKNRGQ